MLNVEHRAFHLYREDAYREYCWSVDAWGQYQPASFIYLCFESFKEACADYGLRLVYRSERPTGSQIPWRFERDVWSLDEPSFGLILRIEGEEDVAAAEQAVSAGRNVIALIPTELLSLFYPRDQDRLDRVKAALERLAVRVADWELGCLANPHEHVRWVEIARDTPGRLFVTRDAFLSDGYFLRGYGYSEESQKEITALIQAFACFKYPLLRMSCRNAVSVWPTGEPLTVVIDVQNHGPQIAGATVLLSVSPDFEPLSPLERKLPGLRSLERCSFSLQLVPRLVSRNKNILTIGGFCDILTPGMWKPAEPIILTPSQRRQLE